MRRARGPGTLLATLVASAGLLAQSPPALEPAFEVASIKPRVGERPLPTPVSPDRFSRPDTTLRDLIRYAYDLTEFQLAGGPDWVGSSRFDVHTLNAIFFSCRLRRSWHQPGDPPEPAVGAGIMESQ